MVRGPDLQRLPIDVLAGGADRRWRPDPKAFPLSVADYERQHADALADGAFTERALALWGLIAHEDAAVPWCRDALRSSDGEWIQDALSVLAWLGVPADLVPRLTALLERMPDSELRDTVQQALSGSAIPARAADADGAADRALPDLPLAGAYDPFTQAIYFLRARYEAVVAARREAWSHREAAEDHRGPFPQMLALLEPFTVPHYKALVVACQGDWTAVFDQGADLTNTAHFARALHTQGLRTSYSPHVLQAGRIVRYGGTGIWMTDGSRTDLGPLCGVRSIQASYQSGWEWHLSGETQPWEDPSRYARRLVPERFDLPLLNDYCRALGIRRDDFTFYEPRATLFVEDTTSWPTRPTGVPSDQWRREHATGRAE